MNPLARIFGVIEELDPAQTRTLMIGLAAFVGLPLAGWGVGDLAGFFAGPARLIYAGLVLVLTTLIVIFMPNSAHSRGPGARTVARQRWAVVFLQLISIALVVGAPYGDRRGIALTYRSWGALVLVALAIAVLRWRIADEEAMLHREFGAAWEEYCRKTRRLLPFLY